MALLPTPAQVARSHVAIFENFYKQVDPAGRDHVAAGEAASFLKRSGLSDGILSKIWDMSDPQGKGFLDKRGFFVALKLIALSQNGKDMTMSNLALDVLPPVIKADQSGRNSPAVIDWTIKPSERKKYEEMFYSMTPVNNKLPGDKVKDVMLNSKLPMDVLGKIWDLSDTDQDGCLSKEEFILSLEAFQSSELAILELRTTLLLLTGQAMHLIYKALENIPVPPVLPPELTALLKSKNLTNILPVLPDILPSTVDSGTLGRIRRSSTPSSDVVGHTHSSQAWVVSSAEKSKFDELFFKLDTDFDGFVTGVDIKQTFLESGLPPSVLALIWNLCDIRQNGKLNAEQFALAMHFVKQKLQGHELPNSLLPEMIPPTLRPKPTSENLLDSSNLSGTGETETTGNKELDLITGEIKELQTEKSILEKDLAQKDADVKIRNGELKNCQNELEALNTMLKQLEMQKGEAGKRLNDLDNQKKSVDLALSELIKKMEDESEQIELLKKQKEEQKLSVEAQEEELQLKKQEVAEIKQEEAKLELQIADSKPHLDTLTNKLQGTQLQISQIKLKIDHVTEQNRLIGEAIDRMSSVQGYEDLSSIPDFVLSSISPIHEIDTNSILPNGNENVPVQVNGPAAVDGFQDDPFKNKDPFSEINGFSSDPFAGEDPFKSADPFKESRMSISGDPFAASDPFSEPFGVTNESQTTNGQGDPFQENDPFGSLTTTSKAGNDPFDPFGLSNNALPESSVTISSNADPFGADPFGPSPVAPPRPTSPTPALPPKKSKAPPPRPAPPKIASSSTSKPAPTRAAPAPPVPPAPDPFKLAEAESTKQSQGFNDLFSKGPNEEQDPFDPFSNTSASQDSFANFDNFADFDNAK